MINKLKELALKSEMVYPERKTNLPILKKDNDSENYSL